MENQKEMINQFSDNAIEQLSITKSECIQHAFRTILIDNNNKIFITRVQNGNNKSREVKYPFGDDKKETLNYIIEQGKQFCYKIHRIYPKNGEFAELYK